jgi:hypothetical protein
MLKTSVSEGIRKVRSMPGKNASDAGLSTQYSARNGTFFKKNFE